MKQNLKAIFKGPVVFYPLLFAAFPILFLYAYNIRETSMSQVWLPLGVSVVATLVLWAVLSLILGSLAKAGLATAIFLLFFFSYGRLYEALETWGVFVPKHYYLLPIMLFVWGYCVYFIRRAKRDFHITTRVLNIMAVVLITINVFNIGAYQVRLNRLSGVVPVESPENATSSAVESSTLPDIYLIILDEYAHPDTMKEYYDYDNSDFINTLISKGFFIATNSEVPTPWTPVNLASVLNMEDMGGEASWDAIGKCYLEFTSSGYVEWDWSTKEEWIMEIYQKLAYNKAVEFLRMYGYKFVYFGSWYEESRYDDYLKDNADLYFNYYEDTATQWTSEFQKILWDTTMLRPFYYRLVGGQYETAYRRQTLYTLEHLKALPEIEDPKFVFAHLMCPHEPFVFSPEGEFVAPENWDNFEDKQCYLDQYIFISTEIEKVINSLIDKSGIPPIIILRSDHGLRPHFRGIDVGSNEWRKIINTMYLPGTDYAGLSDSISPVNTFRLIFNHYFSANYTLLEND